MMTLSGGPGIIFSLTSLGEPFAEQVPRPRVLPTGPCRNGLTRLLIKSQRKILREAFDRIEQKEEVHGTKGPQ